MEISRVFLLAVLFAVPAVAQDQLQPKTKIYIELSGPEAHAIASKALIMARIQIDCEDCVETINRSSTDFVLNLEQIYHDRWRWVIYAKDGTEWLRGSDSDSLKGVLTTVSLRFSRYSEILSETLSKLASKPKASKPTQKATTRRTI